MNPSESCGSWFAHSARLTQLKCLKTEFSSQILVKDPRFSNAVSEVTAKEF